MDEGRVAAFVGFAAKARKIVKGEAMLKAIREEKVKLALIDVQASENTKKRYENACRTHNIPLFETSRTCVGKAIGAERCMALAIMDGGLAQAVMQSMDTDGG